MDTLTTGMSAVRAAQILVKSSPQNLTGSERLILRHALELVNRITAATVYLDTGSVANLEDDALVEARYARTISKQLNTVWRDFPTIRIYLDEVSSSLTHYLNNDQIDVKKATRFLGAIGQAMITEVIGNRSDEETKGSL